MGAVTSLFSSGGGGAERDIRRLSKAPFEAVQVQRFLPPELRQRFTGPIIGAGLEGIGELVRRPGGLSPAVAEAILPRLAAESERIGQEFRGIRGQQAGAAARGNVPVSIRTALESALDVAQERAQRGARREALSESEALRREDLSRIFPILDALLQFTSAGRGQAIQGLGTATQAQQGREASQLAFIGNLLSSLGIGGGGRSGGSV